MNRFRKHDGAAAVEMGLLLPLLVVLAFGIIEFSTAYNRSQGLEAAVREGGRLAATGDATIDEVRDRVRAALQGDEGGAGFSTGSHVNIEAFNSPPSYTNDPDELVGAGTATPCDGSTPTVHLVVWIDAAHRAQYGLDLIAFPTVALAHESTAVMPCLNHMP